MSSIKTFINVSFKPRTFICNEPLMPEILSNAMKKARITPIFIAGEKHMFTNITPVSPLPEILVNLENCSYYINSCIDTRLLEYFLIDVR